MKEVNMAVGRFQPFTKGHLQMLLDGKDKNGLPSVVLMIKNSKPDNRHPFSDGLIEKEIEIVKKNYPGLIEDIILVPNADMVKNGQLLSKNGYQAQLWLCGEDREAPFKKMADNDRYREEGMYPDGFTTYTGSGRKDGVSATAVREALKSGDKNKFKQLMPKGTDKLLDELSEEMSKVQESDTQSLSDYVTEAISSGSYTRQRKASGREIFVPTSKAELIREIERCIIESGPNCDLNHIDVSEMEDLSELFYSFPSFDGDISDWDVSRCVNMRNMFYSSKYTGHNGDISDWDVRNLKYAGRMFYNSKYDGDISRWDLKSLDVRNSQQFLAACPLSKNRKHWPKRFR